MLSTPVARGISKRKQRAAFLRRITAIEIAAGTKTDFVIVVPLAATSPSTTASLLILNRSADAIARLQTSLAHACCTKALCSVCVHFRNLPRLPVAVSDRLILSRTRLRAIFEARLARLVQIAASLVATDAHELKCVAQIQSIVTRFFVHGMAQLPP